MPKCRYCGRESESTFVCCYCREEFCPNHKLPENHQCKHLPLVEAVMENRGSKLKTLAFRKVAFGALLVLLAASILTAAVLLSNRRELLNPTYANALEFVGKDQTEKNQYKPGEYTCINFAADFRNNAHQAGYKCGFVFIYFASEISHTINCFNTTDRGIIFVEPQEDGIVSLVVGQPYWPRQGHSPPAYNDTITGYFIVW